MRGQPRDHNSAAETGWTHHKTCWDRLLKPEDMQCSRFPWLQDCGRWRLDRCGHAEGLSCCWAAVSQQQKLAAVCCCCSCCFGRLSGRAGLDEDGQLASPVHRLPVCQPAGTVSSRAQVSVAVHNDSSKEASEMSPAHQSSCQEQQMRRDWQTTNQNNKQVSLRGSFTAAEAV